jgi:hypothetical protein
MWPRGWGVEKRWPPLGQHLGQAPLLDRNRTQATRQQASCASGSSTYEGTIEWHGVKTVQALADLPQQRRRPQHQHQVCGEGAYLHWGWGRLLLTSCSTAPASSSSNEISTAGWSLGGHASRPLQAPEAQQMDPAWLERQASASAGGMGRLQWQVELGDGAKIRRYTTPCFATRCCRGVKRYTAGPACGTLCKRAKSRNARLPEPAERGAGFWYREARILKQ